ncbi:MAG: reverse transcriptase domain-containing protein, partial [Nitrososphaeraceae archaeon]
MNWNTIGNNAEIFKKACDYFEVNINLNQPNNDESKREIIPPSNYGTINYESEDLLTGSQDIFGDSNAFSATVVKNNTLLEDPKDFQEAMNSTDTQRWRLAAQEEYDAIIKNKTYELTELPTNKRAIPCKWVFRRKVDSQGNVIRYKGRIVVKGFLQKEGRDYNETFAPVMKYTSLRMLLSIACTQDLEIKQFDIDSAFLN